MNTPIYMVVPDGNHLEAHSLGTRDDPRPVKHSGAFSPAECKSAVEHYFGFPVKEVTAADFYQEQERRRAL
jgi:hypothetical protein